MQTPPAQLRKHLAHGGFSLVEMLIVLAVLAAVAAITLPAMRGPLDKSRLTGGARQIQTTLAKARSLAIRESATIHFRYEISGDRYVIERAESIADERVTVLDDPSEISTTPSGLAADADTSGVSTSGGPLVDGAPEIALIPLVLREGHLPAGVLFAEPAVEATGIASDLHTAPIATNTSESSAGLRRWSHPVRFTPNGRTIDHRIRISGQRDFVVDVTLRGLTATSSYTAPFRVVALSGTPEVSDDAGALP